MIHIIRLSRVSIYRKRLCPVKSILARRSSRPPSSTTRPSPRGSARWPSFTSGYDKLIYSTGFLVGWPVVLFLVAERLRNLGRYTFSDVAAYRLKQTPVRVFSTANSLLVVILYLIAQVVGAGKLIQLLFGMSYLSAVILVGVLTP